MYTYLKSNAEVFDPEYHFLVARIDEMCVGSSVCVGLVILLCVSVVIYCT